MVVAKTGMGSSAALISSLVGGLLSFFDAARLPCFDDAPCEKPAAARASDSAPDGLESDPDTSESLALTHNLAQACHCVAQGKVREHRSFTRIVV